VAARPPQPDSGQPSLVDVNVDANGMPFGVQVQSTFFLDQINMPMVPISDMVPPNNTAYNDYASGKSIVKCMHILSNAKYRNVDLPVIS
jgi:hypothetical protein